MRSPPDVVVQVAERCVQNWREEPVFCKPVGYVPGGRKVGARYFTSDKAPKTRPAVLRVLVKEATEGAYLQGTRSVSRINRCKL